MLENTTKALAIATYTLVLLGGWHSHAAAGDEGPTVSVSRLVVAQGVEAREPVGAASEFSHANTSHLFAFVEVQNPAAEPTEVAVTWVDVATGKSRPPYTLQVGPHPRFRTWMRAAAPKAPGTYEVVVTDVAGYELARAQFTITE